MRFVTALSAGLALFATSAQAALTLNIESVNVCSGESYFEVFFTEVPPAQDEQLVAYAVTLNLLPAGPNGPRFGVPTLPVERPFVLPGAEFDVIEASPHRVQVLAATLGAPQNIDNNEAVLRVPLVLQGNPMAGLRAITFELTNGLTEFSDELGNAIPFVPVSGAVVFCPEPSLPALALMGFGLMSLRRRRRDVPAAAPAA